MRKEINELKRQNEVLKKKNSDKTAILNQSKKSVDLVQQKVSLCLIIFSIYMFKFLSKLYNNDQF